MFDVVMVGMTSDLADILEAIRVVDLAGDSGHRNNAPESGKALYPPGT